MKVICIEEECHGHIGIVQTEQDILPFLVLTDWLTKDSEVYTGGGKYQSMLDIFGANWYDRLCKKNLEQLSKFFDGLFYFTTEEVYHKI